MSRALAGIRVVDVADVSGAFAGKLLAGLGADVVHVEPPGGSALRRIPPFAGERSLFHAFYAAGKRSVTRDDWRDLVADADVLVETIAVDTSELRERNPGLVVASITPFGRTGPYATWKSSDTVAQAMGGMLYVNGHPDGPPLRSLGLQAYHQAGVFAAIGVIAALLVRERTGTGQDVDVSLQAAVAASLEHVPGFWHQSNLVHRRQGTLHWTRYFRVGRCRDGLVMHCTLGDWTSLVEWLKSDDAAATVDGPEWDDIRYRQANAEHLFDVLDAWATRYTVAELVDGAQLRRIPYAAVKLPEALLADEHLVARNFFTPDEAGVRHPGAPFRLTDAPWVVAPRVRDAAPVGARGIDPGPGGSPRGGESRAPYGALGGVRPAPCRLREGSPRDPRRPDDPGHAPLAGVRILDFTWVVAGPVTTRILADLGAEVIKVEKKNALDFGDRRGGLSGTLMRGKRSVVLNLADPRGVDLARRLAAASDIVIDNFSARVMTNLGLDYDALVALRPDVICVRMTGFGLTGPHRDHVSYGPTLQAISGYTQLMGEPGREPAGFGYSYSDLAGGNLGALAVLAALRHRATTGRGQLVDLAQLEAVASVVGPVLLARAVDGGTSVATGNASQEAPAAPHGVYRCAGDDRWVAITVFTDDEWRAFAAVVARDWTRDARFATVADRVANTVELDRLVGEWTIGQRAEDVMARLQGAGVAAGVVADAEDLCVRDPQLAARGHFVDVATPEGGTVRIDGPPFVLSETPARVRGPGPLLGEHTDAVLSEVLGLGADELQALRADGIIAGGDAAQS